MKQFIIAACLALACAAIPASAADVGGPGDAGIYTTTLANGLQVVAIEDHTAPVVETAMWYRFGSLDEVPGKTGLAHALEHMMFRGTKNVSAGGLDDIVARLGAQMNGETTYDYTQFYLVMPADKLDVALYVESDRLAHALIAQSGWQIERGAVLNELEGDEGSPIFNLLSHVRAAAYPGQPNGRTPTGLIADVRAAKASDIAWYYHRWYAPNNATLVVAGDIDHAAVFAKAQRYFGSIARKNLPAKPQTDPIPVSHTVTVESDLPFPFTIVDLAYAVPGDTEAGEPEISTLDALVGNQLSPFYQALVQSNVALAVETQEDTQLKGGLFHVFIVLNPGHTTTEAQQIFQSTMDNVLASGYNSDLVAAAKNLEIADRLYAADSVTSLADLAGYTYGIVRERLSDEDARIAAITPQSLLAVTKKYLSRPTVIGLLTTDAQPQRQSSNKSSAAISDDFSKRVPSGPIVMPAAIRAAIATPTTSRSKLDPVAFTLPNGIRVIVQEKRDRKTFTLQGSIASSPAFVPAGKEGLSRLASSVANYGSANYPFTQRRRAIDMMGAVVNNGAKFGARGQARDFSTIVKILADGEVHPSFSEPWLSLEREQ
ncbi:MAG TPA: insulinase family protein, partial [Candidatus Baltobacteraceae bacterium]|nr:insulinase family protein [Candidatus Baltobacteraceae bacterium]